MSGGRLSVQREKQRCWVTRDLCHSYGEVNYFFGVGAGRARWAMHTDAATQTTTARLPGDTKPLPRVTSVARSLLTYTLT